MKTRVKHLALRLFSLAFAIAALFGFRCPAQGCPACKLVGK